MTWTVYRLARLPLAVALAIIPTIAWSLVCLIDPYWARHSDWPMRWRWLAEWLWPPR